MAVRSGRPWRGDPPLATSAGQRSRGAITRGAGRPWRRAAAVVSGREGPGGRIAGAIATWIRAAAAAGATGCARRRPHGAEDPGLPRPRLGAAQDSEGDQPG